MGLVFIIFSSVASIAIILSVLIKIDTLKTNATSNNENIVNIEITDEMLELVNAEFSNPNRPFRNDSNNISLLDFCLSETKLSQNSFDNENIMEVDGE